jgi:hypothetical protein
MKTAIVRVAPFIAILLGACGTTDSVQPIQPSYLSFSANTEVVSVSPTKVRVSGVVTNTDSKAISVSYSPCSVAVRVDSKSAGPKASSYEVDPLKGPCLTVIYTKLLNAGESVVVGQVDAVLTGNVPAGGYNVTAIFFGAQEASAGSIQVQ